MMTTADMACDAVLEAAFDWVCRRRRGWPADADVWSLRRSWKQEKELIRDDLLAGRYRYGLLTRITLRDGEELELWSARDALVLKALAIVLARHLPVSPRCAHMRGHGGAKGAVRQVVGKLAASRFVFKTDVKSYYASIDHHLLLDRLAFHIKDKAVLNLIGQYLRRTAERGGVFWSYDKGISLGCPLSPLIGAFFLDDLDRRIVRLGLFYLRYMDDILVLSPSRWKLRRAVRVVNRVLGALRLEKHPDKTFIGRIERGFDFLGYHFGAEGLSMAKKTIERFVERALRLYEQEPGEVCASARLGAYVRRWLRWANAGLGDQPYSRPHPSSMTSSPSSLRNCA